MIRRCAAGCGLYEAKSCLVTKAKDIEKDSVYEMYYDFKEPLSNVPSHRVLAINRGEREEYLQVSVDVNIEPVLSWLNKIM